MSIEHRPPLDQQTQAALAELRGIISRRYPAARFAVTRGDDPDGVYLKATVDLEDVEELIDQELLDQLFTVQVEQGLPVYVIPLQPAERVLAGITRRAEPHRPAPAPGASATTGEHPRAAHL